MIEFNMDNAKAVLTVAPLAPLAKEDFEKVAKAVDPFIEENGSLAGLIINAARFPGWKDFGAMLKHFQFVREHHRKIRMIAVVTDSPLGEIAEHITSHFVAAEVRHFNARELREAEIWIMSKK